MESNVVEKFFCRDRKQPLLVGSIKSNVGNTEGAAAFMSIMKTLFALDDGTILPNIHITKLNEEIQAIKNKHLKVLEFVVPTRT